MNKRRDFLKISALASATVFVPNFLQGLGKNIQTKTGRKLIILQLSGGNDGLNTCIPYRNDLYYSQRPNLAIPKNGVLKLDDTLGLHPNLPELRDLYDQGNLGILNQVGYPNADRSHFRSMDIWHSASNSEEYWQTGWLGRYLDNHCSGQDGAHQVIELGGSLSLAVKGKNLKGLGLRNPKQLHRSARDPFLSTLSQAYSTGNGPNSEDNLGYMYKTLTETFSAAEYIYEKSGQYRSKATYPQHGFGQQVKLIAELICSGIDTTVFYASLSGFDTHVRQRATHDRLLKVYSESVGALVKELKQNGQFDNTLILTFSEFGRRVAQNASGGTDHGKANSLFLIGGKLNRPGLYNDAPNLTVLDEGDVPFAIDFRQVYADILQNWLAVDADKILGRAFVPTEIV